MPIKRIRTRPGNPWGCVGKKRYETQKGAKEHEFRDRFGGVHAYQCMTCEGWHLGHKKRPRKRQAA